jgi:methionyl-tRNA formyltransferase
MGADLLVETLEGLRAGTIVPEKQDIAQATLAPLLKKEDGAIDWSLPAQAIHNRVRGLQPWPGAQTGFRGSRCMCGRRRAPDPLGGRTRRQGSAPDRAGCQREAAGGGLRRGRLELLEVQLEGRKRISAADFANGQRLTDNDILGEPRI